VKPTECVFSLHLVFSILETGKLLFTFTFLFRMCFELLEHHLKERKISLSAGLK
jgi:hypothetical protein